MIPRRNNFWSNPAYQLAFAIAVLCIVLQYMGLENTLAFQRPQIANGQWWLLLSGNFVHLGENHLWMNMAGLALIVALVWKHFSAVQWLALTLLCSVGVGVGIWFFNPDVAGYVGFSGALHGLIIAGSIADLRSYPRSAALLLVLVTGKLLWEQFGGALPGSESMAGGHVLVDAHLYGAIVGALTAPALLWQNHKRQNFNT